MSWIEQLWHTFEANQQEIGRSGTDDVAPLLPVCHSTQQAQVEIAIDGEGRFLRARVIDKEDARTIIPTTEASASRAGSKPINHPLCDKLQYVAGDFVQYGGAVTSGYAKNPREPFEMFVNDLTAWCESAHGHPKAKAVLNYVRRESVTKDLIESGILHVDEQGSLLRSWNKDQGDPPDIFQLMKQRPQWDIFVRWSVEIPGDPQSHVWTDGTLHDSWIAHYADQQEFSGLCYVTGAETKIATLHPAKLRHDADSAKIISGNDTSGFTFRGRFTSLDQAVGVSFDVTQKAHNALRWLVRNQGTRLGDFVVVAWAVKGEPIPDLLADTSALFDIDIHHAGDTDAPATGYTGEEFARRLHRYIWGYGPQLGDTSRIVVMGLGAATPGRMSILFYRTLTGSDFLTRIENWHNTCAWQHTYRGQRDRGSRASDHDGFIGAPAPMDIVDAAYGSKVADTLRNKTVERLLPCIVDGRRVPVDLVEAVIRRASNPNALERWEWMKAVTIACSLYRKLHEEEEYDLILEENRRSRDYLYGRLLALAHNIEQWALRESGESRSTNAERLMQRFAERPYSTWRTIELSLAPYKARLGAKGTGRTNLISEIVSSFNFDDFTDDRRLSGEFLLGFHTQLQDLRRRRGSSEAIEVAAEDPA